MTHLEEVSQLKSERDEALEEASRLRAEVEASWALLGEMDSLRNAVATAARERDAARADLAMIREAHSRIASEGLTREGLMARLAVAESASGSASTPHRSSIPPSGEPTAIHDRIRVLAEELERARKAAASEAALLRAQVDSLQESLKWW
ncbi:MAG: hypothetical protein EBZ48_14875 [Proteobacteria bacterium]|nr:hypothetical protein [Pseudomonadota bacterium]